MMDAGDGEDDDDEINYDDDGRGGSWQQGTPGFEPVTC